MVTNITWNIVFQLIFFFVFLTSHVIGCSCNNQIKILVAGGNHRNYILPFVALDNVQILKDLTLVITPSPFLKKEQLRAGIYKGASNSRSFSSDKITKTEEK